MADPRDRGFNGPDREAVLALCLEHAGRLRALASTAAMEAYYGATMERTARDAADASRERMAAALDEFSRIVAWIRDGDEESGLFGPAQKALAEEIWAEPQIVEPINAFIADSYFIEITLARADETLTTDLRHLAETVGGPLAAALDKLIERLSIELTRANEDRMAAADAARGATRVTLRSLEKLTMSIQLIAVNASVEAARAGEQGLGFAVIAQEIKKLAENASGSVAQIKSLDPEASDPSARLSARPAQASSASI